MLVNTFDHYDSDDSTLLTQSPVTCMEIGNNITISESEVSKEKYKIFKWHAHKQFKLNSLNYIYGKRAVGKSTLFNSLYSLIINQIEEFFVFTAHPELYSHLTCESHIFTDFKHFESLIDYFKKNRHRKRLLLIDELPEQINCKSASVKNLFMTGRHLNVTTFIITQYPYNWTPELRAQIDNCFFFCEGHQSNLQKIYQQFGGMFHNFDSFRNVYREVTKNFTILILNSSQHNAYWYQAQVHVDLIKKTDPAPLITNPSENNKQLLKSQLKQLKSLCSQILDHLENIENQDLQSIYN